MAAINIIGFIDNVKYLPNQGGCFVFLSEFKSGFKRKDGSRVDDKYLSWKVIFKQGLVRYINDHFSNGMLVEVKGDAIPYAIEHEAIVDGYSVIGQCINRFSFPRASVRQEQRMIKESMASASEIPDLDAHNQPDF